MNTLAPIEIECLCCGNQFDSREVVSMNNLGPVTTDLFEMAAGQQPIRYLVFTCPDCGYTGVSGEKGPLDSQIKKFVEEKISPRLKDEEITSGRRWEFMALISEAKGLDDFAVGSMYLRAAWCSWLDGNAGDEPGYRKKVTDYFEKALNKEIVLEDRIYWTKYLVGEMYRRIGDEINAHKWFDKVTQMELKHPNRDFWLDLARQQKTEPKEYVREPVSYEVLKKEKRSLLKNIFRIFGRNA